LLARLEKRLKVYRDLQELRTARTSLGRAIALIPPPQPLSAPDSTAPGTKQWPLPPPNTPSIKTGC
jgi:hypothetical protein